MLKGYFNLILSSFFYGSAIAVSWKVLTVMPVFTFSLLSMIIPTIVLLPLAAHYERDHWKKLTRSDWFGMFMTSMFCMFLLTIFTFYGLVYTSATVAGIIISSTPIIVLILSYFLLREKLTFRQLIAVAFGVGGIVILNTMSVASNGPKTSLFGAGLVFLAVLSLALFAIYSKKLSTAEIPPLTWVTSQSAISLVFFLPFGIWEFSSVDWGAISLNIWVLIIVYALAANAFSMYFWFKGIEIIPANKAGLFQGFMPVFTVAVAVLFFGDKISLLHIASLLLVLISVALTIEKKNQVITDEKQHTV